MIEKSNYIFFYDLITIIDWTTNPYNALLFSVFMNSEPEDGVYRLLYIPKNEHIVLHNLPINNQVQKSDLLVDKSYSMRFLNMIKCVNTLYDCNTNDKTKEDMLESVYRNTNPMYHNPKKNISKNIKLCLEKFKNNKILFITPNFVNNRIASQQGLFQFPNKLDKKEILNQLGKSATIIEINKDKRDEIIVALEKRGHNIYRLMPDLANMCTAIYVKEKINIKNSMPKKGKKTST